MSGHACLPTTTMSIPGLYAIGECAGGLWNGGIYTHHVYGGDWGASVAFAMLCVQDIVEGQ